MSWFDRPEGFQSKSFDAAAPTTAASNGIRSTCRNPSSCRCSTVDRMHPLHSGIVSIMSPAITFTPYANLMTPLARAEEDLDIHNGECSEPTCDEHMRLEEEVDLQSFEF